LKTFFALWAAFYSPDLRLISEHKQASISGSLGLTNKKSQSGQWCPISSLWDSPHIWHLSVVIGLIIDCLYCYSCDFVSRSKVMVYVIWIKFVSSVIFMIDRFVAHMN